MLRRAHELMGMRVHATDGDIGHVHDLYVDDRDWAVRYVHVDTRRWFGSRHVLLAPAVIRSVDWDGARIHVTLSREHVENSPDIDAHRPVSRQHDAAVIGYLQPLVHPDSLWEGEELAARLHTLLTEMRGPEAAAPRRRPTTRTSGAPARFATLRRRRLRRSPPSRRASETCQS